MIKSELVKRLAKIHPYPGFPRWIEAARAKALEFLAKTQIPTFTRHSVTRSWARSWQTLEPRAEFVFGIRERQAYLGNPG